ncbi:hypothetical protein [Aestuariicoccus sp. MJ-SS9]|uniref:hypothetical protein n=1 Tax=Aestuariicoccus sp. MJ-SS9 TaxID=3079855 RepID=UPI002915137A|nr:hypothetical protein [Aestuariicoccus sp. MJ-SS9]MDU8911127.1 hypothetical protein [Aestuariicoccus sp. MJ-SS9]
MRFERTGRSWTALIVLLGVWAGLFAAYLMLAAAGWIVAALLALSLPAAWDFAAGRRAGLTLDDDGIAWFSGRMRGEVRRAELDHVRLDRRLDMTTRVSLVTTEGRRIRLPQECVPPLARFEAALEAASIRTERHPFSLL